MFKNDTSERQRKINENKHRGREKRENIVEKRKQERAMIKYSERCRAERNQGYGKRDKTIQKKHV